MTITIESTDILLELDGGPVRLWTGTTAAGVRVFAFVKRVAVRVGDDETEFAALQSMGVVSADVEAVLAAQLAAADGVTR
jgi:hypothetical protein